MLRDHHGRCGRAPVSLACIVSLFALSLPAVCAPNGLTQIPIAKVFTDGVAAFSIARVVQSSQSTTYTTQYGIGNQFEFGVDYQAAPPGQQTLLSNFKYLLAHRPGRLPDISGGLTNVATGQKAIPYLVATSQPRATGVSLGIIRPNTGGAYYGMAGVSYNISPAVEIVGDYIGGKTSYGTLGVIDNVTKTISVNVAYAQPNTAGNAIDGINPRGFVVNLSYVFHLKPAGNGGGGASKNPASGGGGGGGG